jgi:hypothetical protein
VTVLQPLEPIAMPHPQLGLVGCHDDFRLAVAVQVALRMQQPLYCRKAATA